MAMLSPHSVKRRRARGGTWGYHEQVAGLALGPESLEELAGWPSGMMERLLGEDEVRAARSAKLASLLSAGMVLHTDCSGRMTPENTLAMMAAALCRSGVALRPDWLVNWRGCDTLTSSQRIMAEAGPQAPVHIFSSVLARMPPKHQAALKRMKPEPGAGVTARTEAYNAMGAYLRKHRSEIFARDTCSATCLKHPGKACYVSFQDPEGIRAQERPLTCAIKGFPCTPFSAIGNQEGLAHPAMEVVHACIQDMAASGFDLLGVENSDRFPPALFEGELPSKYVAKSLVFGPDDLGFPIRRRRYMCTAINQETLVWIGPPTAEAMEAEFREMFYQAVQLEADDFLHLDSAERHRNLRREFAKRRGVYPNQSVGEIPFRMLLSPGQQHNLEGYCRMRQDKDQDLVGVRGTFCADLSQDPEERPRCGPWFPTFARSSMIVSLSKMDFFTNAELDFVMGFPSLEFSANAHLADCCPVRVHDLERSTYCKLLGNGMHVACLMAFWSYIFMNCVRREVVEGWRPGISLRVAATPGGVTPGAVRLGGVTPVLGVTPGGWGEEAVHATLAAGEGECASAASIDALQGNSDEERDAMTPGGSSV